VAGEDGGRAAAGHGGLIPYGAWPGANCVRTTLTNAAGPGAEPARWQYRVLRFVAISPREGLPHLCRIAPTRVLVEWAPGFGRMQYQIGHTTSLKFALAFRQQIARDPASSETQFDKHVENVSTSVVERVNGVRRPTNRHEADRSGRLVCMLGHKSEICAISQARGKPFPERFSHGSQRPRRMACFAKHFMPMPANKVDVVRSYWSDISHVLLLPQCFSVADNDRVGAGRPMSEFSSILDIGTLV